jgi:galactokinase
MSDRTDAPLVVSVPWPVRLFGDFQYFLGMPALVAAVDLRTAISASPRPDDLYLFKTPWNPDPIAVDAAEAAEGKVGDPSIRRTLRVLAAKGMLPEGGYDFQLLSRVPWREALPDSAATAAAWTVALLGLGGRLASLSGNDVAGLVVEAFAEEQPSARPVPEIYAATLGGTLLVGPGDPPTVVAFDRNPPGLLCCVVPGGMAERKPRSETVLRILQALAELVRLRPEFDVRRATIEEVVPAMSGMEEGISIVAYAQIVMRDLCRDAHRLMEDEHGFDDDRLGEMLDGQHEMLRDYLGCHAPKVERLLEAAMGAGNLGGKILTDASGLLLFAPGREDEVTRAVAEAGGEVHGAVVSDGMRVERVRREEAPA